MGMYAYQTIITTGERGKPSYILAYRGRVLAYYDKNNWCFGVCNDWENHAEKVIEWIKKYYPGYFIKNNPGECSFYGFTPTTGEGIEYIKTREGITK